MKLWREKGGDVCGGGFWFCFCFVFQEGANPEFSSKTNFVTKTNCSAMTIPPLVSVSYFPIWVGRRAHFHMVRVGGHRLYKPILAILAEIHTAIMPSKCQLR